MSQKILGYTRKTEEKEEILKDYKYSTDKSLSLGLVYGQDETITRIRQIVEQIKYKKVYDHWASLPPRGLIFHGPPGTGKTFTARCLATEIDATVIEIRYQDVASPLLDKPIEFLNKLRLIAEKESVDKHVIIFIDEIDAFLPARSLHETHEQDKKKVNFLLGWMSGNLRETQRLTFIGTTNRLDAMDPAALRPGRFTEKFEFKSLEPRDVYLCLKSQLDRRQKKAGATLLADSLSEEKIIPHLAKLSGADVEYIVDTILFAKAYEHCNNLKPKVREILDDKPELTEHNALSILVEGEAECEPSPISAEDVIAAIIQVQNKIRPAEKTPIGFK